MRVLSLRQNSEYQTCSSSDDSCPIIGHICCGHLCQSNCKDVMVGGICSANNHCEIPL